MAKPDVRLSPGQPENSPTPALQPDGAADDASRYCPRCEAKLEPRSCKLICVSCGYYMSCSDFY